MSPCYSRDPERPNAGLWRVRPTKMWSLVRTDACAVTSTTRATHHPVTEFRHEALLYRGPVELGAMLLPIIRSAIDAGDSILVALDVDTAGRLRRALGDDSSLVTFVDMRDPRTESRADHPRVAVVRREARCDRGDERSGLASRSGRAGARTSSRSASCTRRCSMSPSPADRRGVWCAPTTSCTCPRARSASAFDTHPLVPGFPTSADPVRLTGVPQRFSTPLPEPAEPQQEVAFETAGSLARLRAVVMERALEAGLDRDRAGDLALAVSEVAANSVRYGGGGGALRIWLTPDALVCEVRDRGHIDDPLVGRSTPEPMADGQRGLWLVNQLCDLVQLRSLDEGVVVRLHAALPRPLPRPTGRDGDHCPHTGAGSLTVGRGGVRSHVAVLPLADRSTLRVGRDGGDVLAVGVARHRSHEQRRHRRACHPGGRLARGVRPAAARRLRGEPGRRVLRPAEGVPLDRRVPDRCWWASRC